MKYKKTTGLILVFILLVWVYFYLYPSEGEEVERMISEEETVFVPKEIDYEEILEIQKVTNKMDFGPLNNVYEDPNSSFSIRYPDELEVVIDENGSVGLKEKRDPSNAHYKGFVLYISNQDNDAIKPPHDPQTIDAFKINSAEEPLEDGSYRQSEPFNPELIPVAKGDPVLKQLFHDRMYDKTGRDVTGERCDLCAINDRMYVVFKSPDDYHVITSGGNNDFELEDLIIRSIEY